MRGCGPSPAHRRPFLLSQQQATWQAGSPRARFGGRCPVPVRGRAERWRRQAPLARRGRTWWPTRPPAAPDDGPSAPRQLPVPARHGLRSHGSPSPVGPRQRPARRGRHASVPRPPPVGRGRPPPDADRVAPGEELAVARRGGSGPDERRIDQPAEDGVQDRRPHRHPPATVRRTRADPLGPRKRVCAWHRVSTASCWRRSRFSATSSRRLRSAARIRSVKRTR